MVPPLACVRVACHHRLAALRELAPGLERRVETLHHILRVLWQQLGQQQRGSCRRDGTPLVRPRGLGVAFQPNTVAPSPAGNSILAGVRRMSTGTMCVASLHIAPIATTVTAFFAGLQPSLRLLRFATFFSLLLFTSNFLEFQRYLNECGRTLWRCSELLSE